VAVGKFSPLPTSVPVRWIVFAVIISTVVGLFFGVYPAYKASKLNPIEALRFET
jgi:putative ABC transport system permease protein